MDQCDAYETDLWYGLLLLIVFFFVMMLIATLIVGYVVRRSNQKMKKQGKALQVAHELAFHQVHGNADSQVQRLINSGVIPAGYEIVPVSAGTAANAEKQAQFESGIIVAHPY